MSRKIAFILVIAMAIGIGSVFAAQDDGTMDIPQSIRNNRFFLESVRLARLANETFEYGDYDASENFAQEAIRFAQLSDEFVILQLKIKEADDAIAAAKRRLDWAVSSGAANRYPNEYSQGQSYYNISLRERSAENWDEAIAAANRVIDALAYISPDAARPAAPPPAATTTTTPSVLPLPSQYTVRTWSSFRDCLWNIAGYSWVYNDPHQWRILYNANKSRMPQPENPDLIEPGMILDIPSIRGESRQGMWSPSGNYAPLR
jgi:tetratricopeptide (TPR) repeat protein